MELIILLRASPDYKGLNNNNFYNYDNLKNYSTKEDIDFLKSNDFLKNWNDSFYLDFPQYRLEISDICLSNLKSTKCNIIYGENEFDEWFKNVPEHLDYFILPINDDDLLHDNILEKISTTLEAIKFLKNKNFIVWKKTIFHSITKFNLEICEGFSLKSNSWAIRKSFLKKINLDLAKQILFLPHKKSESIIAKNLPKHSWEMINETLSLYCRHVGEIDFLVETILKRGVDELYRISSRELTKPDTLSGLEWSTDYLNLFFSVAEKMRSPNISMLKNDK